jgi:hypothetical protein
LLPRTAAKRAPKPDGAKPPTPKPPRVADMPGDLAAWTERQTIAGWTWALPGVTDRLTARAQWFRAVSAFAWPAVEDLGARMPVFAAAREALWARGGVEWDGWPVVLEVAKEDAAARALRDPVASWAARWHMEDLWLIASALRNLRAWQERRNDTPDWRPGAEDFLYPRVVADPSTVSAEDAARLRQPWAAWGVGMLGVGARASRVDPTRAAPETLRALGWRPARMSRVRGDDTLLLRSFVWLVEYQVNGLRWNEIDARHGVRRNTALAAAKRLAALLGLTMRPSPLGRPAEE